MGEPSDADWIARSLQRPSEFAAIFDRHAETLLRFLVRRAGPEIGSALLGELFRVAFERRERFDLDRSSARPWLYGIATNLLLHRARSDGRRARATRTVEDHQLSVDPAAEVERVVIEEIDARLMLPRLATALRSLPEGEREALLLLAWEDLSYGEIAEALDVPLGTVRSRIHRGRTRLREQMGLRGKEEEERTDAVPSKGTES